MKLFCSCLILFFQIILAHGFKCPENIDPCKCNVNTGSLICVGAENKALEITEAQIKAIGENVKNKWGFLHIENTNLATLPDTWFPNVDFEKIFIIKNTNLISIKSTAFAPLNSNKATNDVVIRENSQLDITDDFTFLKPFKANLKNLELEKNSIKTIKSKSFEGYAKLEMISLDSQHLKETEKLTIEDSAFVNLINLKELNLSNNKISITSIANKPGIDLAITKVSVENSLVINLNKTISKDDILKPNFINLPTTIEGFVSIYLNDNTFTLKDGLIDNLISKAYVFIDAEKVTCECNLVKGIANILKIRSSGIQSPYPGLKCDKEVKIINC